jgi:hypothetical protein
MEPRRNSILFPIIAGLVSGVLVWLIASFAIKGRDEIGGGWNGMFFTSNTPPETSLLPFWLGIGAFMVAFTLVFVYRRS